MIRPGQPEPGIADRKIPDQFEAVPAGDELLPERHVLRSSGELRRQIERRLPRRPATVVLRVLAVRPG
ncbi:hypothetical protein SDC9_175878 [bioreactor metagenome]|uniref:Uncharacterized protein n=1 Tax=bioreactor metagenome TaxID=1076179 RepID=A0A645GNK0_9ZZZZ